MKIIVGSTEKAKKCSLNPEPKTSKIVNFKDYRVLADHWLEDRVLWP
jgi:hypothetical protein